MTIEPIAIGGTSPTNDAADAIAGPWHAKVNIQGSAPIIMHRWSNEAVKAKATAAKNSTAKKSDNVESYVYRLDDGKTLAIPGEYLRQAIIGAGRYHQDPRSPRKSAMDLLKAAILVEPELASLGVKQWDYLDRRRVVVQRNAITRERPALAAGWRAALTVTSLLPDYVDPTFLLRLLGDAGRLIGIGDFRPTYGRFDVIGFEIVGN